MELQTTAIRPGITGADPLLSGISDDSCPPGQVEPIPFSCKEGKLHSNQRDCSYLDQKRIYHSDCRKNIMKHFADLIQ